MSRKKPAPQPKAQRRTVLTEALADIVLSEGLEALSLRPAAARLGTSDRMLLYYFGSKADLVSDVLGTISARLAERLAEFPAGRKLAPTVMIARTAALLADPSIKPFMRVWTEIVARAVRDDAMFRDLAQAMFESWLAWIAARVAFPKGVSSRKGAAAILAVVEGFSTLELIVPGATTGSAVLFEKLAPPRK